MVKTFEVLSWHEWTELEEIHVSPVEGVSPPSSEVSLEPPGKRDTVLIDRASLDSGAVQA